MIRAQNVDGIHTSDNKTTVYLFQVSPFSTSQHCVGTTGSMPGRSLCVAFLGSRVWEISIGRMHRGSIERGTVKRGWIARAQEATEIVSVKNRRIKEARGLLMRRHREQSNKILLEGQRLISDAVEAGISPHEVYYTNEIAARNDRVHELLEKVSQSGAETFVVSDGVIRALSDTVTPQVRQVQEKVAVQRRGWGEMGTSNEKND